jgi:phospholipid-binding lipoprotein MlaA
MRSFGVSIESPVQSGKSNLNVEKMQHRFFRSFLSVLACSFLSFHASAAPGTPLTPDPNDPIDPYHEYNHAAFNFNNYFYTYVATPINDTYIFVTPEFVRTSVGNFFDNVNNVPNLMNDALQWNWGYFGTDALRLILNTTLGLFGLIDVAGAAGFPAHQQGFSYTLAKWGDVNSDYFVMPFFGPGTVSSAYSLIPTYFMSPLTYVHKGSWTLWGIQSVQTFYQQLPVYNAVNETAVDPYVAIRNAYLQNRAYVLSQINAGTTAPSTEDTGVDDSSQMSPALMAALSNS